MASVRALPKAPPEHGDIGIGDVQARNIVSVVIRWLNVTNESVSEFDDVALSWSVAFPRELAFAPLLNTTKLAKIFWKLRLVVGNELFLNWSFPSSLSVRVRIMLSLLFIWFRIVLSFLEYSRCLWFFGVE